MQEIKTNEGMGAKYFSTTKYYNIFHTAYSIMGAVGPMPVLAIIKIGRYRETTVPREVRKLLGVNKYDEIE